MSLVINDRVNPIGLMKTWVKLSCTICMKERVEMIDHWQGVGQCIRGYH